MSGCPGSPRLACCEARLAGCPAKAAACTPEGREREGSGPPDLRNLARALCSTRALAPECKTEQAMLSQRHEGKDKKEATPRPSKTAPDPPCSACLPPAISLRKRLLRALDLIHQPRRKVPHDLPPLELLDEPPRLLRPARALAPPLLSPARARVDVVPRGVVQHRAEFPPQGGQLVDEAEARLERPVLELRVDFGARGAGAPTGARARGRSESARALRRFSSSSSVRRQRSRHREGGDARANSYVFSFAGRPSRSSSSSSSSEAAVSELDESSSASIGRSVLGSYLGPCRAPRWSVGGSSEARGR